MKPTTKILFLIACFVSSISPIPVFPITGATPIPPTTNLALLGLNPQTIPSLTTHDHGIVSGVHLSLSQDSLMEGSSNNVDRETILFPRAHTDESADEKLNPLLPQLTLQVLDSETQHKMDALTRSLKVERTALQALAENLQDDRQIRSCSYSRYENEILRLMERNSAFVNFELSLIKDGVLKVTYKEYRPKLIHIMMELIKVYQNAWNSEIVRSYARIFVDIYVKKEAEHGRKYKGVAYDASGVVPTSILKDHGPNFSGEQLLGELEEEWKEFCAKEGKNGGTPLPKEGSQSKSLVLPLRPGPGSHTGHTTQSQR